MADTETTSTPDITALRHSPLEQWAGAMREGSVAGPRGVSLREIPFLTMVGLRVTPGGTEAAALCDVVGHPLPERAGAVSGDPADVAVLWQGPDEFLVVGPDETVVPPALAARATTTSPSPAAQPTAVPVSTTTAPSTSLPSGTSSPSTASPTATGPDTTSPAGTAATADAPEPDRSALPTLSTSPLAQRLADALVASGGPGQVVDLSANRTTLELSGPSARAVLEKGCPVDLHPRAFPVGSAVSTTLALVQVLLWRTGEQTWRIMPRASFAQFTAQWLLDAMTEFASPEVA